jgi:uncharacterized membrane protein
MAHHSPLGLQPPKDLTPDRIPMAAWVLGLSCLLGQLLLLGEVGAKEADDGMVVSMAIGALVIGWVAFGVLRGRTVRLVIAGLLLVLGLLGYGIDCVDGGTEAVLGWPGAHLGASAVSVAALVAFVRTDYFARQRRSPRAAGPSLAPLVAIAVLVGLLGGAVNIPERSTQLWVRVSL